MVWPTVKCYGGWEVPPHKVCKECGADFDLRNKFETYENHKCVKVYELVLVRE